MFGLRNNNPTNFFVSNHANCIVHWQVPYLCLFILCLMIYSCMNDVQYRFCNIEIMYSLSEILDFFVRGNFWVQELCFNRGVQELCAEVFVNGNFLSNMVYNWTADLKPFNCCTFPLLARARICKCLRSPGIDFASLCSLLAGQYLKWGCRTGPPGRESIHGFLKRFTNSDSCRVVRQPYLTYRPARLHRLAESILGIDS